MKSLLLILALAATACGGKTGPYDRLCKIYEGYGPGSDDAVEGMQIYERVQREIPEVIPVYDIVVRDGIDTRYNFLRDEARKAQNQPGWECDALRKHWPPGVRR